jgi:hypothetical protein
MDGEKRCNGPSLCFAVVLYMTLVRRESISPFSALGLLCLSN